MGCGLSVSFRSDVYGKGDLLLMGNPLNLSPMKSHRNSIKASFAIRISEKIEIEAGGPWLVYNADNPDSYWKPNFS